MRVGTPYASLGGVFAVFCCFSLCFGEFSFFCFILFRVLLWLFFGDVEVGVLCFVFCVLCGFMGVVLGFCWGFVWVGCWLGLGAWGFLDFWVFVCCRVVSSGLWEVCLGMCLGELVASCFLLFCFIFCCRGLL